MRTAFINQLIEEAKENDKIFLIVGDLGFSVVEPFAELFPNRFLNVGIAEQNMTGVAAGLAKEGYNVFTYSIGNFPTLRCIEQIRYDVCYHNFSVKIIAVGGGYAYGPLGASHHTTEEIGMLRTIPNLQVIAPGDPVEVKNITKFLCSNNLPCYMRLGKAGEPTIHPSNQKFGWGSFVPVHENFKGTVILSSGGMLKTTFDYTQTNKLSHSLISVPFIKPLNIDHLERVSKVYDNIITIEEHQKSCGFGSAILEGLHDLKEKGRIQNIPNVRRIAIPDKFIDFAGSQDFLRKEANLII